MKLIKVLLITTIVTILISSFFSDSVFSNDGYPFNMEAASLEKSSWGSYDEAVTGNNMLAMLKHILTEKITNNSDSLDAIQKLYGMYATIERNYYCRTFLEMHPQYSYNAAEQIIQFDYPDSIYKKIYKKFAKKYGIHVGYAASEFLGKYVQWDVANYVNTTPTCTSADHYQRVLNSTSDIKTGSMFGGLMGTIMEFTKSQSGLYITCAPSLNNEIGAIEGKRLEGQINNNMDTISRDYFVTEIDDYGNAKIRQVTDEVVSSLKTSVKEEIRKKLAVPLNKNSIFTVELTDDALANKDVIFRKNMSPQKIGTITDGACLALDIFSAALKNGQQKVSVVQCNYAGFKYWWVVMQYFDPFDRLRTWYLNEEKAQQQFMSLIESAICEEMNLTPTPGMKVAYFFNEYVCGWSK